MMGIGMESIRAHEHELTRYALETLPREVPGIEIYGGIVLNRAVGGINPAAVEWMTRMSGARGKVVWLPTFDADLVGGGSREGTSYGVAMRRLWELYDWWHATTGEVLFIK